MKTKTLIALAPLFAIVISSGSTACRGEISDQPPVHLIRNMFNQARWDAQEETTMTDIFPDKRKNRPIPAGTVAVGALKEDELFYRGKNEDGTFARGFPMAVTMDVMKQGERRFNTYCTPCHGPAGAGNGMVATRGNLAAANLTKDQYKAMPEGELFNTITNGKNTMSGYAAQIRENDRWAIVAYLRALQRSQSAKLEDLPEDKRRELQAALPKQ